MRKKTTHKSLDRTDEIEMRPEYDFSGGIRGKHYQTRLDGYTIKIRKKDGTTLVRHIRRKEGILLEPDVKRYFPDSKAVNTALRAIITLFPKKRKVAGPKVKSRTKDLR